MEQANIPEFTEADKREANFHNFDETPEVVGKLIRIETGSFGDNLVVDTVNGEVTIGVYEALKSKITKEDIGKFVKIVCLGNKVSPKTRRSYKDFEVFVK
ncbi:MAG: hypothetical protein ACTSVB_04520 [Candidatus Heimdallarchaeaceae archaeon]